MAFLPLLLDLSVTRDLGDLQDALRSLHSPDVSPALYNFHPSETHLTSSPIINRILLNKYLASAGGGGRYKDNASNVVFNGKNGFQISLNVKHFEPNELTVKAVDNMIVIEGEHKEREDKFGFISREFTRKYVIPEGYDVKDAFSILSSDGVLTVKIAKPIRDLSNSNERLVQIQQTGRAHFTNKDEVKKVDDKDCGDWIL